MHVVILGSPQALVVQPHAVIDLAAIERVSQRIDVARFATVAEGRRAAAESGRIQRAGDGFPCGFRGRAADAPADDIPPAGERVQILLQKILRHARVRVRRITASPVAARSATLMPLASQRFGFSSSFTSNGARAQSAA